jgi:hypothetical protein
MSIDPVHTVLSPLMLGVMWPTRLTASALVSYLVTHQTLWAIKQEKGRQNTCKLHQPKCSQSMHYCAFSQGQAQLKKNLRTRPSTHALCVLRVSVPTWIRQCGRKFCLFRSKGVHMIGVRQTEDPCVAVFLYPILIRLQGKRSVWFWFAHRWFFVGERCVACLESHDSITKQRVYSLISKVENPHQTEASCYDQNQQSTNPFIIALPNCLLWPIMCDIADPLRTHVTNQNYYCPCSLCLCCSIHPTSARTSSAAE